MKKEEFRQDVNNKFIEMLEKGGTRYQEGFKVLIDVPYNGVSKHKYGSVNAITLNGANKPGKRWYTFNQIADKNNEIHPNESWHLQKGSKGKYVESTFYSYYDFTKKVFLSDKEYQLLTDDYREKNVTNYKMPYVRYNLVFNEDDIDGIPPLVDEDECNYDIMEEANVSTLIDKMGVTIAYDAYAMPNYDEIHDVITIPTLEMFESDYAYNSVMLELLAKASQHKSRLNKILPGDLDDLSCEIACVLGSHLFEYQPTEKQLKNKMGQINSWKKLLRSDIDALPKAIKQANAIVDYFEGLVYGI